MKEKGISLLASLSLHAVFLFMLIRLAPPIRIYIFRHAADVRIFEPGVISYSGIEEIKDDRTRELSSSRSPSGDLPGADEDVAGQVEMSPGVVYLKNLDKGREGKVGMPEFDLIPSPKSEGKFSLAINPEKPTEEDSRGSESLSNLDFSTVFTPALSYMPFNRVVTDKKGVLRSGQIDITDRLEEYDLEPWVELVVDKIRNNWTPPPIDESIAIGEVRILLVVTKDGHLFKLEVVAPSGFPVFDRTTVEAIRSSAPFPPLPSVFPKEKLEAFLVFEFHE